MLQDCGLDALVLPLGGAVIAYHISLKSGQTSPVPLWQKSLHPGNGRPLGPWSPAGAERPALRWLPSPLLNKSHPLRDASRAPHPFPASSLIAATSRLCVKHQGLVGGGGVEGSEAAVRSSGNDCNLSQLSQFNTPLSCFRNERVFAKSSTRATSLRPCPFTPSPLLPSQMTHPPLKCPHIFRQKISSYFLPATL